MRPIPTLAAGPYSLRGWTVDDVSFALEAARDPEIARFSSVGRSVTPAAAREWIHSRSADDRLDWVIESAGAPIGRVSLAHIDTTDSVAEVGYWVLPEHRRRGVAATAVGAAEIHALGSLGTMRLIIRHEPENTASCAFANLRGYVAEGTERGAFFRAGQRRDLHVHALLSTDDAAQRLLVSAE